jgi:hypothetical protein
VAPDVPSDGRRRGSGTHAHHDPVGSEFPEHLVRDRRRGRGHRLVGIGEVVEEMTAPPLDQFGGLLLDRRRRLLRGPPPPTVFLDPSKDAGPGPARHHGGERQLEQLGEVRPGDSDRPTRRHDDVRADGDAPGDDGVAEHGPQVAVLEAPGWQDGLVLEQDLNPAA